MKECYERIYNILKDDFEIDFDKDEEDINNEGIFGYKIGLSARDLVYLIVILEKEFNIKFDYEDFDSDSFYTIRGIADTILMKRS